MNKIVRSLAQRSVTRLIQVACGLALLGLASLVWSILDPTPLPVIAAMSVGHVLGGSAFACYLLAIFIDMVRSTPRQTADGLAPPPEGPFSVRPAGAASVAETDEAEKAEKA